MGNYFKSIFNSNEFDILVKENKLRSEYLSVENKSIIKKLINRLSASKLSAFDIQIFQKDFIGMALEAEQRGETLGSTIGNDMNSFCDEIIKNGRKKSFKETVILAIPSALLGLTLIYGIIYILMNSCAPIIKVTLRDSFFYLFWILIVIPLRNYLSGRAEFESKFKKALFSCISLGIFAFLLFFDNIFLSKDVILFQVIGWIPLAALFVLLMIAYFLRNNYLHRLAKGYNWSDR